MGSVEQIHATIEKQLEVASLLLSTMRAEHDFLSKHDTEALLGAVEQKQGLLAELERSSSTLLDLLREAGCSLDKDGIASLMAEQPDESHRIWEEFQQTLAECQKQNMVNGQIMEVNRHSTEQALSILLGYGQAEPSLYDDRGMTNRSIGGKSHIKV